MVKRLPKSWADVIGTPVPSFAMRLALGEQSTLVLEGQQVLPTLLEQQHFIFKYPYLKQALENLLKAQN